jgi:hypothetical protein
MLLSCRWMLWAVWWSDSLSKQSLKKWINSSKVFYLRIWRDRLDDGQQFEFEPYHRIHWMLGWKFGWSWRLIAMSLSDYQRDTSCWVLFRGYRQDAAPW